MNTTLNSNTILDRPRPRIKTSALLSGANRDGNDKYTTVAVAVSDNSRGTDCEKATARFAKHDTVIGTWNVRSLSQKGKLEVLVNELNLVKWNIVGISELRWLNMGETTTDDGNKLWYSGEKEKHQTGVGILVDKQTAKAVTECTPVSNRIIAIRVKGVPACTTIVQIYAPTSSSTDDDIDAFYSDLEDFMKKIPKKDIVIVQGDWNAKIGTDAYTIWKGTVGKFGTGVTNERGERLLEFAKRYHLIIANTLHDHKASRTTSWHSPDGVTHNQIDFILVSKKHQSGINRARTRTYNKPDIGSDHDLVMMTFRLKLTKIKKVNIRTKLNLENFKNKQLLEQYQTELAGKFAPLLLIDNDSDPQQICDEVTSIIYNTAEKILGKTKASLKPWITPDIIKSCDERRKLKAKRFDGEQHKIEYRNANRKVKTEIAKAKDTWVEEQAKDMENCIKKHNTRKAFQTVKKLTSIKLTPINVIEVL